MILHYLKTALRNLMKYKMHSLISVICLAIGITCFSLVNYFINTVTHDDDLPDNEQRIGLFLVSEENGTTSHFKQEDYEYLESQKVEGMGQLVATSYLKEAEVTAVSKDGLEQPFIINYKCVSSSFFQYKNLNPVSGRITFDAPDEVVVSRDFAHRAFGKEDAAGKIIQLESIDGNNQKKVKDYRIAGVVDCEYMLKGELTDCYFPLSMNPYTILLVSSTVRSDIKIKDLNTGLEKIKWGHGTTNVSASAYLQSNRDTAITAMSFRFLSSLILLSGLINFLKFIIQMFYNRQRELVLRKCIGSDNRGLFYLLFSETLWMISVAFMLSIAVTEISVSLANVYIPKEDAIHFDLTIIYISQLYLYVFLLVVCISVILYPVYKLRKLNIVNSYVDIKKRHVFRNVMISVQLAISIFFVGGVFGTVFLFHEIFKESYSSLSSEEEKRVISMSVNSIRMRENMDAILSDIAQLPEIEDRTSISFSIDLWTLIYMSYSYDGKQKGNVNIMQGNPNYFEFFKIPVDGKIVGNNEESMVYVSERFKEQLINDGIEGSVTLNDREYQIAGTYRALYKEIPQKDLCGSVFVVNPSVSTYYFKTSESASVEKTIKKITEVCRRYVPETLPLDIREISDTRQTTMGTVGLMQNAFILLAVVSLLLVIFSIYSAITMDAVNRQKEVAIRKINGAKPKTIALLFGKVYLIIYVPAFCIVLPILKLLFSEIEVEFGVHGIYSWDKCLLLFLAFGLLVFSVIAHRIYKVMHLNPADIIKKE